MVIDAARRAAGSFIAGDNRPLAAERKEAMKKELLWFAYRLTLICCGLELHEGISFLSEELGDLVKRLIAEGKPG